MIDAGISSSGIWAGAVLAGYCFGCLDMAWILAFLKGRDIKHMGNGNPGAGNALMTMGIGAGALTAAWDIGKACLAYAVTWQALQGSRDMCLLSAACAVLGHCFPFWMDFRGGKGFAPFLGFMLCGDWQAALLPIAVGLVMCLAFDRIAAMTFTCAALWPFLLAASMGLPYGLFYAPWSVLLAWNHWDNIRKILDGTEPGVRDAFRGRRREP